MAVLVFLETDPLWGMTLILRRMSGRDLWQATTTGGCHCVNRSFRDVSLLTDPLTTATAHHYCHNVWGQQSATDTIVQNQQVQSSVKQNLRIRLLIDQQQYREHIHSFSKYVRLFAKRKSWKYLQENSQAYFQLLQPNLHTEKELLLKIW